MKLKNVIRKQRMLFAIFGPCGWARQGNPCVRTYPSTPVRDSACYTLCFIKLMLISATITHYQTGHTSTLLS